MGYTPGELTEAIDGNARDIWHVERGKHELGYVLRDNGHIDDFRAMFEAQKNPAQTNGKLGLAAQNTANIKNWLIENGELEDGE